MNIAIPELSLVILIGASGSGKSTFARKHFKPTEVISSDFCRGLVSDDENDQTVTAAAFEILHFIAAKRLEHGKLTVVDATNVQSDARKPLVELARQYHCLPVAIVLDLPESVCWERTQQRSDRNFERHVVRNHRKQLHRSLKHLKREGFRHIFRLTSEEEIEAATITRQPLWNNLKHEHGPFDIIGDVHGCGDELEELLAELGYVRTGDTELYQHPAGRKAIFLGDLMDRGNRNLDVYQIVRAMVENGNGLCVPGNHDMKLVQKLKGQDVRISHGLATTLAEIEAVPEKKRKQYKKELVQFFRSLISHYVLDDGNLVVAHAGMKASMQGRGSGKVRDFALYGETTGERDEFGLPIRLNWAADYRGEAMVVYGHTPVAEPQWLNRTINIDTGCVFGGKLTALRYPEEELVSVPANRTYFKTAKPFLVQAGVTSDNQPRSDGLLHLEDVTGKRIIETRLNGNVTIREENSIAALEVISRFAVNPQWLIYLPPTMSPSKTSKQPDLLEHPMEAFDHYRKRGVSQVVCEQKHMGSRAVVIVCRDEAAARARFGVVGEGIGVCYTRTGRRFFTDAELEASFLNRVQAAIETAGWWQEFETDWVCLDCELMPWSAKAQDLLREQYAAIGTAAAASLDEAIAVLEQTASHNPDVLPLLNQLEERKARAGKYTDAYRQYCWPVNGLDDLKLAPFHLLATENKVHVDKDHVWHMNKIAALCQVDEKLLLPTPYQVIDLADPDNCNQGIRWWEALTEAGGEGMVVKPLDFIAEHKQRLIQPAIKSRGREYLRIIYGPEYTAPQYLERLRSRNLARKRSLALREFALGVEALERFITREPLYRVHECVFGVLALESEPVDPRL